VPIPQFVLDLRARVGHDALWLPGVTAVVLGDDGRVLLVRRADNDLWTLVTGGLDPGEQPAVGAVREVAEETAVIAVAERIVSVSALPLVVYENGDQVHYLDVALRCRAVSGTARVNDDESVDVGWFKLDELPASLPDRHRQCIQDALGPDPAARFDLG
jgi:ADP-ribose pyrophosphatase YjhB (NUDIX family)